MKKLVLFVLAMLYTTTSFAIANIVMPDLKMAGVISESGESNTILQHSVTNSISKFSANIRDALIIGALVQNASIDLASNVVDEMNTQYNFMITNEKKSKSESVVVTDVKVYN
jgi:hypothetical protein